MPRLMAEEELAKLKSDFNLLQSSWRDENENFLRFQLIANRDLQLANHVLTEKQKGDLDVLKNAQKDRERRKSVTSNLSTSKSLDAIETSAQYILIEKSELRKIQEEIAAAEERLKILEAQKESQDKSREEFQLLKKESLILLGQTESLSDRLKSINSLVDNASRSLPSIKEKVMNEMTFVKKIKKNRYTDEIEALHVMQDAISSSSEDELRHLRENKGDVQRVPAAIQSAQFKTCPPNHTQNRNQNYENFIEKIAETRSRAQLKTNLLKDEIIQLNNSYNQFVKRISRRTKDNAAELQTMKNTLEAIQNSRERNIEDYEKLKFKISALETQSASESKELNRRVKSLSVELEKLRKLETLQSLEELENPENSSN